MSAFRENLRQVDGFWAKVGAYGRMMLRRFRQRAACCGIPGAAGC